MKYSNPMLAIKVLSELQNNLNKSFHSKTKSNIKNNKNCKNGKKLL
tara:strand:+ start:1162 stop:1299 length:138 start_codon:yes stop_codon:yes gene_type:complete